MSKPLTDDQLYDADSQDPDRIDYQDDYKQKDPVNAAEERNRLLDSYFRDLDKIPQLMQPGETKAALVVLRKMRKGTKRYEQLRNQLIEEWLHFTSWAASKHRPHRLDYLDALQMASLVLVQVIDSVDPSRLADEGATYVPGVPSSQGGNFGTYLLKAIKNALWQATKRQTYPTSLPYDIGYRLRKAEESLLKELQREPTREELSALSGVREDTIASYHIAQLPAVEISAPLREEDDSASEETVGDYIEQSVFESPEEQLLHLDTHARVEHVFTAAKPALTDMERTIIKMRFGLTDGIEYSVYQIAKALNLTLARARILSDEALKKLKTGQGLGYRVKPVEVQQHLDRGIEKVKAGQGLLHKKRVLQKLKPKPCPEHPLKPCLTRGPDKGKFCSACALRKGRASGRYKPTDRSKPVLNPKCGHTAPVGSKQSGLCKRCWDKLRWKQGGKLRRQLAQERRLNRAS